MVMWVIVGHMKYIAV